MRTRTETILVAFQVTGQMTRTEAMQLIMRSMPMINTGIPEAESQIECWWLAEDDRIDGSDNSSAVFCTPGFQPDARIVLDLHGMSGEPDYEQWSPRVQAQRVRSYES
jgi:hypothetical protein